MSASTTSARTSDTVPPRDLGEAVTAARAPTSKLQAMERGRWVLKQKTQYVWPTHAQPTAGDTSGTPSGISARSSTANSNGSNSSGFWQQACRTHVDDPRGHVRPLQRRPSLMNVRAAGSRCSMSPVSVWQPRMTFFKMHPDAEGSRRSPRDPPR